VHRFRHRAEAGRELADRLTHLRARDDAVVLGLPRGGVPVAFEVATRLHAPLDVIVVRKLGLPSQRELAMGAIGEGGFRLVDHDLVRRARVTPEEWRRVEAHERRELDRQIGRFRSGRDRVELGGRLALIVDDGIATGYSARVACDVVRHLGAARVVLAVPVAPAGFARRSLGADEVVAVVTPRSFRSVGEHYDDFDATSDDEVVALLDAAQ
jgi:putative phosphoribosyl transferase